MSSDVTVERVESRQLAAVVRRVRVGEVATAWRQPLDMVWAFLRRNPGLRTDGHNVFLYRHPARREDPMEVSFGVEVPGPFEGEGEVVNAATPAGLVAATVHRSGYDTLAAAHDAIHTWREAQGREFAGWSWEIYGDPEPTGLVEVRIEYLLASDGGEFGREG
jgi:effector-binding domain-containing protein